MKQEVLRTNSKNEEDKQEVASFLPRDEKLDKRARKQLEKRRK